MATAAGSRHPVVEVQLRLVVPTPIIMGTPTVPPPPLEAGHRGMAGLVGQARCTVLIEVRHCLGLILAVATNGVAQVDPG
jgi:hypothetical protein